MAVRIKSITFDCTDPYRLAQFWSELTGFTEDPDNRNAPEDQEAVLLSPAGRPALLFIAVPEQKHAKNRLHLDLVPIDRLASAAGWSTTASPGRLRVGGVC